MNAGYIPKEHWVHENGGRIVGEACHVIDLMTFFTKCKIISVSVETLSPVNSFFGNEDNRSIILKYSDGSIATIEYFSVGSELFPKEYMELHFDQKTIVLNNYESLKGYGLRVKGKEKVLNRLSLYLSRKTINVFKDDTFRGIGHTVTCVYRKE